MINIFKNWTGGELPARKITDDCNINNYDVPNYDINSKRIMSKLDRIREAEQLILRGKKKEAIQKYQQALDTKGSCKITNKQINECISELKEEIKNRSKD